jgi:flagellar motor protein MotB
VRREINPWPALSDLFSGLLVATFGGLMLFTGAGRGKEEDPVESRAREISRQVIERLQQSLGGNTREMGGDTFLDVRLSFELNKDEIQPSDRERVRQACKALQSLVSSGQLKPGEIEIWIEGHSDSTQPKWAENERDRYLFNWRLSGSRAASVLYEFRSCGFEPSPQSSVRIFAIGYADTRPIPGESSFDLQRRTTFRIRPDRCAIRALLEGKSPSTECTPF